MRAIARKLVERAREGDMAAVGELCDRVSGRTAPEEISLSLFLDNYLRDLAEHGTDPD